MAHVNRPSDTQIHLMVQLLVYFFEHPEAKDTLDGILKWWLPRKQVTPTAEDVRILLGQLVKRGWIIQTLRPGSRPLYSLNLERLQDLNDKFRGTEDGE